jgi:SH3-like domain-containing protein
MTKRKRYGQRRTNSSLLWTLLALAILISGWLVFSIWKGINPVKIFSELQSTEEVLQPISYDSLQVLYQTATSKSVQLEEELALFSSTPNHRITSIESGTLNMRSSPNTSAEVIEGISSGDTIRLYYCQADSTVVEGTKGTWCKILYNKADGWVWSGYLTEL